MSYAGNFLRRYGQVATIDRTPPTNAYVNLKRSTKAIYSISLRDTMFEGLIESSSNLVSGETFSVGSDIYLTQTADPDPASKEIIIFVVRTNSIVSILREEESVDENFNLVKTWKALESNLHCYKEVVTRAHRQYNAGLLDNTIYTIQIPKAIPIQELDRITFHGDGKNYKVEAIDPGLDGVYKLQLSLDTRV